MWSPYFFAGPETLPKNATSSLPTPAPLKGRDDALMIIDGEGGTALGEVVDGTQGTPSVLNRVCTCARARQLRVDMSPVQYTQARRALYFIANTFKMAHRHACARLWAGTFPRRN